MSRATGPGGWQGNTNYPTRAQYVPANSDLLVQMTFLNSSGVPTEPTSIQYRIDSLSTVRNVVGWTSVVPSGSQQILQVPATTMVPTESWTGEESWQLWIQAVIPDTNATSGSITVNKLLNLILDAQSIPGS